ncbi:MAG: hypothetical protein IV097_05660 [Burkholderiaceae bacterium]|nr:hypothetical protein [Burkholderiaceae bacterium]
MNPLLHLVEPERLLMTWQPSDENANPRTRRVVGELVREPGDGTIVFRYVEGTADYEAASAAGFQGFPAFRETETRQGVLETLVRRLPPRRREDFDDFLRQHGLPVPFKLSDFALLGYTGAKLPSDGFALVPEFPPSAVPCDFLMEVAGTRYVPTVDMASLHVGDSVGVELDSGNPVDADALALTHRGQRIGYVNRAMKPAFQRWLASRSVALTVARLNGKPQRPLVYLRVSIS